MKSTLTIIEQGPWNCIQPNVCNASGISARGVMLFQSLCHVDEQVSESSKGLDSTRQDLASR